MDPPKVAVTRRAAISWFAETQASKIVRDGTVPDWFHGITSRRDAEELLKDKSLGCFLIRIGESRIGFSLSYRGIDRCRHFIIDVTTGGQYNISGASNFHHTLQDLVTFHTRVPIVPFNEYLTVPCGQVSRVNADYEELCLLVPTAKKQNSPTLHSHSSAGSSTPTTSHSTSNPLKQVAISPPVPPKGHGSRVSPPPLPHRGVMDWKPVPEPKARTDEPTPLSGRVVVKRLYPSIRSQPTAISMEQRPTPGATVSGPQSPLLQNPQHSNPETRLRDMHISSGRNVSDSKSELKHQAVGNIYGRHPIPIQGQPADHTTDTNRIAPALKYTDYPPSSESRCDQLSPAQHIPLHPPRAVTRGSAPDVLISRSHSQPASHGPALYNQPYSKTMRPVLAEPVRGREPLTDCAEGQIREHVSDRVDLPAEYMNPPPYAPGYQPS